MYKVLGLRQYNSFRMKNQNEDIYQTSDLCLAATLAISYPIEAVDKTNPRKVIFIFKRDSNLNNLLDEYWRQTLKVVPQDLFNQLKNLKTRIYEGG